MIVAAEGTAAALAAKAATSAIPIVFIVGADPVELGLVSSLSRPGGNITGVGALAVGTVAKRLQLLHELVPAASTIAFLRNPTNPYFSALETGELQSAATVIGVRLLLLDASIAEEIEASFAKLVEQRADAFLLGTDPFFITARDLLVSHASAGASQGPGCARTGCNFLTIKAGHSGIAARDQYYPNRLLLRHRPDRRGLY